MQVTRTNVVSPERQKEFTDRALIVMRGCIEVESITPKARKK